MTLTKENSVKLLTKFNEIANQETITYIRIKVKKNWRKIGIKYDKNKNGIRLYQ